MNQLIEPFAEILPVTLPKILSELHAKAQFHQKEHGCGAYSFTDGAGLIALCQAAQPKRILELGCGYGFTSACMAWGLPNVLVDTIEANMEHVSLARKNLTQLKLDGCVSVYEGYFDDVIKELDQSYDLIFFDGYAPSLALLNKLTKMLNESGLLVCANMELTSSAEQETLRSFLNSEPLWVSDFVLENGGTVVAVKQS
ncbi:MAG: methyltransferase domain-containing protein [Bermanella sp.]